MRTWSQQRVAERIQARIFIGPCQPPRSDCIMRGTCCGKSTKCGRGSQNRPTTNEGQSFASG
ncbi:hypothetical protein Z945_1178 [Sulfitobacter noctilucae]|nr:hypothetical protein Z945_1178 [Sulfitobacter noctilucae]